MGLPLLLEFQKQKQGSCCCSFFYFSSTRRRGSQTSWCCLPTTSASTTFPGTMLRCTRPRCRSSLMRASSSTREWSLQKKLFVYNTSLFLMNRHNITLHSGTTPSHVARPPERLSSQGSILIAPAPRGATSGKQQKYFQSLIIERCLQKKASSRYIWKDLNFKIGLQSISTVWPRHHLPSFAGDAQGGRLFNPSGLKMIIVNQNTASFL